jgi:uncharacterized protein (DUF1015 family)
MADVQPLRGIHYNPEVITARKFGNALAPPYDVIDTVQQERLYERQLRNIVRVDYGKEMAGDVAGINDRYTRAAQHLDSWLKLGVMSRDERPAFYVTTHEYNGTDGVRRIRRGIYGRVLARPWEESEVRPHERTMRGPKEDRMRLMETTLTQTSAVFMVWRDADATVDGLLEGVCAVAPALHGQSDDGDDEHDSHSVWVVDDPLQVQALRDALRAATLYIADGHHRYETAAAFAAKCREAEPGMPVPADFDYTLAYMCDAASPGIELLPTHRVVAGLTAPPQSGESIAERAADGWTWVATDDLAGAIRAARIRNGTHHAFAMRLENESGMLIRPHSDAIPSPRERLDVVVLEQEILTPLGITGENVTYTRDVEYVDASVRTGEAQIGIVLNSMPVADVLAVADAGEIMPQKSTYFFPKVPTGEVLSPLA